MIFLKRRAVLLGAAAAPLAAPLAAPALGQSFPAVINQIRV